MRIRIQEIYQNVQINLISSLLIRLLYLRRYVSWPITYIKYTVPTFRVKFTFCWSQSLIRIRIRFPIGLAPWIRMRVELKKKVDPNPNWSQCRSSTLIFNLHLTVTKLRLKKIIFCIFKYYLLFMFAALSDKVASKKASVAEPKIFLPAPAPRSRKSKLRF